MKTSAVLIDNSILQLSIHLKRFFEMVSLGMALTLVRGPKVSF